MKTVRGLCVLATGAVSALVGGTAFGATVALPGDGPRANAGTGVNFIQQIAVASESTSGNLSDFVTSGPVGQSDLNQQVWNDLTGSGESETSLVAAIGSKAKASLKAASTSSSPIFGSGVNMNQLLGQSRGNANGRIDNTSYSNLSDTEVVIPDGSDSSSTSPTPIPLPASAAMGGSLFALMLTRRSREA